jgi:methylenetetrahydrofolate reductase (NADPH)
MAAQLNYRDEFESECGSITDFMSGFTVETTPASAAKVKDFRAIIRPGTTVYITHLPDSDYRDTVATATRLRNEGFEPAIHIAARSLKSKSEFEDYLARASSEAGVTKVLALAGAVPKAIGPYEHSMQLLETGLFDRYGVTSIAVAGHPEGTPDITDEEVLKALLWKNSFAERTNASMYLVTQFCFEAEPIIAWDRLINSEGNRLPIRIGIPGIAKLSTLINYAVSCGVGNSIQFLKRRAKDVTRMLRPQAPDGLVRELSAYVAHDPNCGIIGAHMYPLGGLKTSAVWTYGVIDGSFELNSKSGFDVSV